MKVNLLILFILCGSLVSAQRADTLSNGIIVFSDYRLPLLKSREAEVNSAALKIKARYIKGYRLMVLNTSDKNYAFKVRAELLQRFPNQKPYMWFANPYIRIKFGDFRTKEEAERYQAQISRILGGAKIYLLNETIEVNPGKDFDPESMRAEILSQ
ncbi:MAG: SPOR domain-containing protein [Chitinophagaceae bacterium]|nr:SPOR domain-containing protein [Chitinophagaceae bacterium]